MKIYLDIDGTLIHEAIERAGEPAEGLESFILALRPYDVFWLTTHCMNGDPVHAQTLMKRKVSPELYGDIDRIKPTTWSILKTEALDFTVPFIWFDNDVYTGEWEVLKQSKSNQVVIEIDLRNNPNQLVQIKSDLL